MSVYETLKYCHRLITLRSVLVIMTWWPVNVGVWRGRINCLKHKDIMLTNKSSFIFVQLWMFVGRLWYIRLLVIIVYSIWHPHEELILAAPTHISFHAKVPRSQNQLPDIVLRRRFICVSIYARFSTWTGTLGRACNVPNGNLSWNKEVAPTWKCLNETDGNMEPYANTRSRDNPLHSESEFGKVSARHKYRMVVAASPLATTAK
jgi:hypothetical protein